MVGCAGGILKNEGPLAFHKVCSRPGESPSPPTLKFFVFQGTLTPLMGIGLCVAIQFGALEATKRRMAERNLAAGRGGPSGEMLTGAQLATAGAIAGLSNGVVSGPVEHIRIRASLQTWR
jgi:solute carrier family 25 (mitochondrial carnitine/acylcarnitine transporter), member 20/29